MLLFPHKREWQCTTSSWSSKLPCSTSILWHHITLLHSMKGVGCPLTGQTSRTSVLVLATTTFWERKKISHLNHLVIYKYILLIPWIHIHHFLSNHSWRHIRPSASIKLSALTRSGTFVQTSVSTTKCRHYLQKKIFLELVVNCCRGRDMFQSHPQGMARKLGKFM